MPSVLYDASTGYDMVSTSGLSFAANIGLLMLIVVLLDTLLDPLNAALSFFAIHMTLYPVEVVKVSALFLVLDSCELFKRQ